MCQRQRYYTKAEPRSRMPREHSWPGARAWAWGAHHYPIRSYAHLFLCGVDAYPLWWNTPRKKLNGIKNKNKKRKIYWMTIGSTDSRTERRFEFFQFDRRKKIIWIYGGPISILVIIVIIFGDNFGLWQRQRSLLFCYGFLGTSIGSDWIIEMLIASDSEYDSF